MHAASENVIFFVFVGMEIYYALPAPWEAAIYDRTCLAENLIRYILMEFHALLLFFFQKHGYASCFWGTASKVRVFLNVKTPWKLQIWYVLEKSKQLCVHFNLVMELKASLCRLVWKTAEHQGEIWVLSASCIAQKPTGSEPISAQTNELTRVFFFFHVVLLPWKLAEFYWKMHPHPASLTSSI